MYCYPNGVRLIVGLVVWSEGTDTGVPKPVRWHLVILSNRPHVLLSWPVLSLSLLISADGLLVWGGALLVV